MNLLITSVSAGPPARWALFHFMLVTLALMPALIYGHGHHGSGKKHAIALAELAHGAHLVMETHSGDIHVRPAREAQPEGVAMSAAAPPLQPAAATSSGSPTSTGLNGGNKRVKNNNKKSNKAQNQMQNFGNTGRRNGFKKSSVHAANGEEKSQQQQQQGHHNNNKQQRQLSKHSQQEHPHRTGKRSGAKKATEKGPTCRYTKSSWTECDTKTNMRTRTLSLKKGESNCLPTRTMQKACKKACRYEKGPWSECINGQITREDKLKPAEDGSAQSTCNPVRLMNKKCKSGAGSPGGARSTKERKHKEKGTRRTSPQA